ncbi:hypothetical protein IEU95_07305 [Hoyosella rhizosphaerae]|uniref:Uncharacterized protein n=1 Tax=Hoyosella rhizosphaerae TaxID=1755582 RepID=A0A916XB32_9ACTN|nr:hypothetical protein [Hoyosella rhizosphaerae]MBN4926630.1 hypothetical protein [Hoyosella rhizosphaerae]GGC57697.1 hypothetical protein GCM10011410_07780 [Hoyosella rhizosphaerae]
MNSAESVVTDPGVGKLTEKLEHAVSRLEQASAFAKSNHQAPVIDVARRLLTKSGGIEVLYEMAPRLDRAGVFAGTDWAAPASLIPGLVTATMRGGSAQTITIECLSELRMLAVATGRMHSTELSGDLARHFLTQVLAMNLERVFGMMDEAARVKAGPLDGAVSELFQFLLNHIGFDDILQSLIDEIWRILAQRPIQVGHVKAMITEIAITMANGAGSLGDARLGADRLISSLFGPTQTCRDDPGLTEYQSRLETIDFPGLQQEASGLARAMLDTGLVSDYHALFVRWILDTGQVTLLPTALGLSSTGQDALQCYSDLVHHLIVEAIHPGTAQALYGLVNLLERGILYSPPIAPGLWRQIALQPSEKASAALTATFGAALPPRVHLLAGTILALGLPLGIGQGNNPTCQSARAISMWSYSDPAYLLHVLFHATRQDTVLMHFEGTPISSAELPDALARSSMLDTDAVSTILVPHLDRIYGEMGRLCSDRGEDPHRWINPEFHGWWVGREFYIAVDVATGKLRDYEGFVREFYASYHPLYNGNQPLIHPQPAGLAVTDSSAVFVGWHAITLIRVGLDQEGEMRVYFYNPNNDSRQNWGNGVLVSTQGHGERFGEASLPFAEMVSRLYIFHDDAAGSLSDTPVPESEIETVRALAYGSWAADRIPE